MHKIDTWYKLCKNIVSERFKYAVAIEQFVKFVYITGYMSMIRMQNTVSQISMQYEVRKQTQHAKVITLNEI